MSWFRKSIKGRVRIDGDGLSEQLILLISADATELLGSATTGAGGRYEVEVPRGHSEAVLLFKIRGPVVAVFHCRVDLEAERSCDLEIDSRSERFHDLEGEIETTSGWPPYLTVFVDPVSVDGVPAELEKHFLRQSRDVVEHAFYEQRVDGREFRLRVLQGIYRVGGDHLNYFRPQMVEPDFENYRVDRVVADGEPEPLPGNPDSGFRVEVDRDRRLCLVLEEVPDEELGS